MDPGAEVGGEGRRGLHFFIHIIICSHEKPTALASVRSAISDAGRRHERSRSTTLPYRHMHTSMHQCSSVARIRACEEIPVMYMHIVVDPAEVSVRRNRRAPASRGLLRMHVLRAGCQHCSRPQRCRPPWLPHLSHVGRGVHLEHGVDIARATEDDGATLVDVRGHEVEHALHGAVEHARGRHTARALDNESHRKALVQHAQLALWRLLVGRVEEDAAVEDGAAASAQASRRGVGGEASGARRGGEEEGASGAG